MEKEPDRRTRKNSASVFKAGTVCLVFLIIGFESALFVRRAAELSVQLRRDSPDTVYVVDEALARRLLAENGGESVPAPSGVILMYSWAKVETSYPAFLLWILIFSETFGIPSRFFFHARNGLVLFDFNSVISDIECSLTILSLIQLRFLSPGLCLVSSTESVLWIQIRPI